MPAGGKRRGAGRPKGANALRRPALVNRVRALGSKTRTCGIFGRVIFGTSGIFGNCAAARSDYGCPTRIRFLEGANDFRLST